jgi:hypothetical protein
MNFKVTISCIALSLSLVACKKDLTCSCTTTSNSSGTYYDYDQYFSPDGWSTYYVQVSEPLVGESDSYTEEINYTSTTSTVAAGNCPAQSVSEESYDNTYPTSYYTQSGQPIITGSKGRYTVTRSCTLEKE